MGHTHNHCGHGHTHAPQISNQNEKRMRLAAIITGLLVNILVFYILSTADKENLNVKAAILHVLGDLLGSVAAIIAALIIWKTGFMAIDPIVSVIVALIILRSAWFIVKQSTHILLEGAPEGFDRRSIRKDLLSQFPEIKTIDHIHIWSISQNRPMMTLDIKTNAGTECSALTLTIKKRLQDTVHINHTTVEVICVED